jgi:hypothetical protein
MVNETAEEPPQRKTISVCLTEDQHEWLTVMATHEEKPLPEMMREALTLYQLHYPFAEDLDGSL